MANNRMILLCNVCQPSDEDWQYRQKGVFAIAKWYPGGMGEEGSAYYRNDNGEKLGDEFLEFLEEHKHGEVASEHYTKGAGQENPIRLVYESKGLPKISQSEQVEDNQKEAVASSEVEEKMLEILTRWFKNPAFIPPDWISEGFIKGITQSQKAELLALLTQSVEENRQEEREITLRMIYDAGKLNNGVYDPRRSMALLEGAIRELNKQKEEEHV